MLVHVIHSHKPSECPAAGRKTEYYSRFTEENAKFVNINLIGAYANSLEHTLYLIIEAENNLDVEHFLETNIGLVGTTTVTPVESIKQILESREKLV